MKAFFAGLGAFFLLLALVWVIQGDSFFMYKVFAPRTEAVRRQVFKQSQAYNDGMAQEVAAFQLEYVRTDSVHKELLASTAYHRFASYDINLQDWQSH